MNKLKLKHIKWFGDFISQCIDDMRYPVSCYRYGLLKENWQDFKTRIYFDTDPEAIELMNNLAERLNNANKNTNDEENNKTGNI